MAYKLKTKSAAAKRYKRTKNYKFIRRPAYKGHILEKKSQKRKRNLRRKHVVFSGDARCIRIMLPNK